MNTVKVALIALGTPEGVAHCVQSSSSGFPTKGSFCPPIRPVIPLAAGSVSAELDVREMTIGVTRGSKLKV